MFGARDALSWLPTREVNPIEVLMESLLDPRRKFFQAVEIILRTGQPSVSYIQRTEWNVRDSERRNPVLDCSYFERRHKVNV